MSIKPNEESSLMPLKKQSWINNTNTFRIGNSQHNGRQYYFKDDKLYRFVDNEDYRDSHIFEKDNKTKWLLAKDVIKNFVGDWIEIQSEYTYMNPLWDISITDDFLYSQIRKDGMISIDKKRYKVEYSGGAKDRSGNPLGVESYTIYGQNMFIMNGFLYVHMHTALRKFRRK